MGRPRGRLHDSTHRTAHTDLANSVGKGYNGGIVITVNAIGSTTSITATAAASTTATATSSVTRKLREITLERVLRRRGRGERLL